VQILDSACCVVGLENEILRVNLYFLKAKTFKAIKNSLE